MRTVKVLLLIAVACLLLLAVETVFPQVDVWHTITQLLH